MQETAQNTITELFQNTNLDKRSSEMLTHASNAADELLTQLCMWRVISGK
jgi:hypothetical protein